MHSHGLTSEGSFQIICIRRVSAMEGRLFKKKMKNNTAAVWLDTMSLARKQASNQRRWFHPTVHDSCGKDGGTFCRRKASTDGRNAWLWSRRKYSSSRIAHRFQLVLTAYPHMLEDVRKLWERKENVRKSRKGKSERRPT